VRLEIEFDTLAYRRRVRQFAALTGRRLGEVIREEMRFLVGACINRTPPFSGRQLSSMGNPGWDGSAKKIGERAVKRDIRRVFRPVTGLDLYKENEGFRKAVDERNLKVVRNFLKDSLSKKASRRFGGVAFEADPQYHKEQRDNRGRVRRGAPWIAVLDKNSIDTYIKAKQRLVGYARAGWNAAKARFGATGWTLKNKFAPGLADDRTHGTEKPHATAANLVPWIQWAEGKLGIVRGAMRQRQKAIEGKIRRIVQKSFLES
jgi:hypothetical protein